MDLWGPGLPKKVLKQARSTNTISFRLLDQIQHLNEKTNNFLAILGADPVTGDAGGSGESISDIFTEFYYHLQINQSNGKPATVPEIAISTLKDYQNRITRLSAPTDFERGLVSLINEYTTIVGLHHLANSILYKTIVAKSHLAYWSSVKLSAWSKLVYGIQTLPERIYKTVALGFTNAWTITERRTDQTRFRRIYNPLAQSFKNTFLSMWLGLNVNFILRQSRLLFLKISLKHIDEEIKGKIATLNADLDHQYKVLGVFLNSLPVSEDTLVQILPDAKDLNTGSVAAQLEIIEQYVRNEKKAISMAPPSFVVRYWPILLIAVNYGPSLSFNAWQNRAEIAEWFRLNFVDTLWGFWSNWIIKPIGDMLSILRNDETMTIALKESLQSDLDSLERMVLDYLSDSKVNADPAQVSAAVKQGDLTMVMSQYENALRTPYKSIIQGLLIRSILIQVQKTKVDGDLAINGIDKLLKLQQLLFGVLSILPSLFILYQGSRALRKDSSLTQTVIDRRVDCLKSLNQINRLVNREVQDEKFVSDGKLFVEVVNLNLLSHQIVPKALRGEFVQDLNQLALSSSDDGTEARSAISRIWNMYSPFFRR